MEARYKDRTPYDLLDQLVRDGSELKEEAKINLIHYVLKKQYSFCQFWYQEDKLFWSSSYHGGSYYDINKEGWVTYYNRFCGCCLPEGEECDVVVGNLFEEGLRVLERIALYPDEVLEN